MGATPTSKVDFFKLTGEDELAKQTYEYNKYVSRQNTIA
jgi:hypothetical protein